MEIRVLIVARGGSGGYAGHLKSGKYIIQVLVKPKWAIGHS